MFQFAFREPKFVRWRLCSPCVGARNLALFENHRLMGSRGSGMHSVSSTFIGNGLSFLTATTRSENRCQYLCQ